MLATVVILLLSIISFIYYKKVNTVCCFLLFWGSVCFFSLFRFFGLDAPSDEIYMIVLLGNVCFFVAGMIPFTLVLNKDRAYVEKEVKWKVFNILLVFAVVILLMKIALMLPVILSRGIAEARNLMQVEETMNLSGPWLTLQNYFAKPYIRIALIILPVNMVMNNKFTIKNIVGVLLLLMVSFYSDGGRGVLIYLFITVFYLYFSYRYKIDVKTIRRIRKLVIVAAILSIAFTLQRKVGLLENIYTYYCGSLTYFSKNIHNDYLFNELGNGAVSIQGITRPFFGVLNLFGIKDPHFMEISDNFLYGVQATLTRVSPTSKMNYFITCFGYFYKDFKLIGIIVFSFIYGRICHRGSVDRQRYNDEFYICMEILIYQSVLFSMNSFLLSSYQTVMAAVFLYIVEGKKTITQPVMISTD